MKLNNDDTGQMLLATGVVLMMSLLSMAIFSVKIAGLTIASDTTQSEVVKIAEEIDDEIFQLVSFRANEWYDAGLNETESVALSMEFAQRYRSSWRNQRHRNENPEYTGFRKCRCCFSSM